jgi:hypothetical protein
MRNLPRIREPVHKYTVHIPPRKYGDYLHSQDDGIAWILSGIKAPALRADSGVAAGQKLYHVLLQSAT